MKKKCEMRDFLFGNSLAKLVLTMKFTAFFVLCFAVQLSANVYSQQTRLKVDFNRATVKEVMKEIESQTGLTFFYSGDVLDINQTVTLSSRSMSLDDILMLVSKQTGLTLVVEEDQILVKKAGPSASDMMQQKSVSGKVYDASGSPLPGVSIVIKGTTIGTITGSDGAYNLANVPDNALLVFSFVGMRNQEVEVAGKTMINVTLTEETVGIEEVIAIGYGTMKKSDLTGSISHIESTKITETRGADPISSLQGRVAGIDITSGNKPGSESDFVIRGYNSLSAKNTPLIVLDGVPFSGSLTDINSSEISSMDVLKDASSTAIYGARGANGVIIITTKRGDRKEGFSVKYNGYYGISKSLKRYDMMNGPQYADFKRAAYSEYADDASIFCETELNSINNQNYTDWQDLLFSDSGYKTENNVTVNFNSGKSTNLFSIGHYKDQSILKNMSLERINLKLSGDIEFNDKLSAGYTVMASFSTRNLGEDAVFTWGTLLDPLSKPYDENGNLQFYPSEWNKTVLQSNPLYDLEDENLERVTKRNTIIINSYLKWKISDGLTYQLGISPEIGNDDAGQYYGKMTISRQNGTNYANWKKATTSSINVNNKLNYLKVLRNHKFDVSVMQDFQQYKSSYIQLAGEDIPYYGKWYNVDEAPETFSRNSDYTTWSILSYMGRLNYSYKGKYLFTATGRYDGASVLAEDHKWDFFPSVALGWRITEEPFIKRMKMIDNLKLRISWGNSGQSAIDPYSTLGALSSTKYVFGTNETVAPGYVATSLPNSSLGWEKTEEYNLGLDFSILNYRISGSFDTYIRNTSDVLMARQLPITSGYSSTMQNIGRTRNKGFEVSLNTIPIDKPDFKWHLDFTGSYNKNEIVELYGAKKDDSGNKWFIGKPIYVEWIYKFDGVWQLGEEAAAAVYGAVPGDAKFRDVNTDDKYDTNDCFIYNKIPKYNVGLNSTFEYKNLDLTLNFYGRLDYGGRIGVLSDQGGRSSARYGQLDINYWTKDNPSTEAPKPAKTEPDSRVANSTYAYRDLSFIRLKNIVLGYNVKNKGNLPFRNARMYLSIDNPYVFAFEKNFEALDPENCTSFSDHRPLVSFVLGLNVNF